MRKRLRKKLHVGEFQVFGFRITGMLAESVDHGRANRLFDEWIEFIESRGLFCGGSIDQRGGRFSQYVDRSPHTCTDADRNAVRAWLNARSEIATADVHALEDVWYLDEPRRRG